MPEQQGLLLRADTHPGKKVKLVPRAGLPVGQRPLGGSDKYGQNAAGGWGERLGRGLLWARETEFQAQVSR